jgi:hypothetical protein
MCDSAGCISSRQNGPMVHIAGLNLNAANAGTREATSALLSELPCRILVAQGQTTVAGLLHVPRHDEGEARHAGCLLHSLVPAQSNNLVALAQPVMLSGIACCMS